LALFRDFGRCAKNPNVHQLVPHNNAEIFYYNNSSDFGRIDATIGDEFISEGDFEDILEDYLLDDDFVNGSLPDYPDELDQDGYDGEVYAFLAWASGGTYWDLDALFETTAVDQYRELLVNDMFNKIARQVTDFDDDFRATDVFAVRGGGAETFGDGRDIDLLFDKFGTTDSDEKAKFDLNGDNAVDLDDVILLVEMIYSTWFGDAALDGDVDQDDDDILDANWQQSVLSWLDGDFNGDGVVNAADLNELGQNWLNGT
jgi:hypothetical protein